MNNPDTPPKPDTVKQPADEGLDETACSLSVLQSLVDNLDQYSGGQSLMHPRLTRALMRAKDHLRGTNEREGNHYGPPTRYIVERRRADLDGEWKQVGNEYSTLERAEKEARWERSSRKGMQSRIIPIPANTESIYPESKQNDHE